MEPTRRVIQYIHPYSGAPLRERVALANEREAELAATGYNVTITADSPPAERVAKLVENIRNGYYAIPLDALFPEGTYVRKEQTTLHLPETKDFRTLRTTIGERIPLVHKEGENTVVAQTGAYRVSVPEGMLYSFRPTDVLNATLFCRSLRGKLNHTREKTKDGVKDVWSAGPIAIQLLGSHKPGSFVSAHGTGMPSSNDFGLDPKEEGDFNRQPHYSVLEVTAPYDTGEPVEGFFCVESASADWDLFKRSHARYWNKLRIVGKAPIDRADILRGHSLKANDIAGVLLLDAGLRQQYKAAINHPFRLFSETALRPLVALAQQGYCTTNGKATKPRKSDFDVIANLFLGATREHETRENHGVTKIPHALELDLDARVTAE